MLVIRRPFSVNITKSGDMSDVGVFFALFRGEMPAMKMGFYSVNINRVVILVIMMAELVTIIHVI